MSSIASSPAGSDKQRAAALQLSGRFQQCWKLDVNWQLYPAFIKEVSILIVCTRGPLHSFYIMLKPLLTEHRVPEACVDLVF